MARPKTADWNDYRKIWHESVGSDSLKLLHMQQEQLRKQRVLTQKALQKTMAPRSKTVMPEARPKVNSNAKLWNGKFASPQKARVHAVKRQAIHEQVSDLSVVQRGPRRPNTPGANRSGSGNPHDPAWDGSNSVPRGWCHFADHYDTSSGRRCDMAGLARVGMTPKHPMKVTYGNGSGTGLARLVSYHGCPGGGQNMEWKAGTPLPLPPADVLSRTGPRPQSADIATTPNPFL